MVLRKSATSALLKAAFNNLKSITATNVASLKQSISDGLAALAAVEKVDKSEIIMQLISLKKQIANLSLLRHEKSSATIDANDKDKKFSLKQAANETLAQLQKLVIIRHQQNVAKIISPQDELLLACTLGFLLQQAQCHVRFS